jgi:hypothetical protein
MGVVIVFMVQVALAVPLWMAAYAQYGTWPCVALLATQCFVAACAQAGGK